MAQVKELRIKHCFYCKRNTEHSRFVEKTSLVNNLLAYSLISFFTCGLGLILIIPYSILQGAKEGWSQGTEKYHCDVCGAEESANVQNPETEELPVVESLETTAQLEAVLKHYTNLKKIHIKGCSSPSREEVILEAVKLQQSETVLAVIDLSGFGAKNHGMVITPSRVCWYANISMSVVERVAIPHAEWVQKPLLLSGIVNKWLSIGGQQVMVTELGYGKELKLLLALLEEIKKLPHPSPIRQEEKPSPESLPSFSVADELGKLVKLKEQGVLSEEEFNKMKQDLIYRS